jgi:hypothetical protein
MRHRTVHRVAPLLRLEWLVPWHDCRIRALRTRACRAFLGRGMSRPLFFDQAPPQASALQGRLTEARSSGALFVNGDESLYPVVRMSKRFDPRFHHLRRVSTLRRYL